MNLSDYHYKDLLDMKKAEFDKAVEEDKSNLGYIATLRNYMSLSYAEMQTTFYKLQESAIGSPEAEKLKTEMIAVMMSLEYKVAKLREKEQSLQRTV